ncbi:hypothetical protein CCACVL1_18040 [Corchorus capsularis]|uniref:Uncharacterized protein n=1 Tax=Corchorus capsularis TaxID=210143 RepID=A0A1R3HNB3_COCAP|nr:hypothetical protein CCACVL1_18040 [Corchorus capsularis]
MPLIVKMRITRVPVIMKIIKVAAVMMREIVVMETTRVAVIVKRERAGVRVMMFHVTLQITIIKLPLKLVCVSVLSSNSPPAPT